MLQRMGWKGAGLGAEETGIVEPVKGGEVRDRADMYRGMGNSQVSSYCQFSTHFLISFEVVELGKLPDSHGYLGLLST